VELGSSFPTKTFAKICKMIRRTKAQNVNSTFALWDYFRQAPLAIVRTGVVGKNNLTVMVNSKIAMTIIEIWAAC